MMDFLFNPPLAHFVLRVVIGVLLTLHGYSKIKSFSSTAGWFDSIGLKPGKFWLLVAIAVEFGGGILLVLGILVQLAGLLVAVQMLVAMWKVKWGKASLIGQGGWELELLYFLAGVSLALTGGGLYSFPPFL